MNGTRIDRDGPRRPLAVITGIGSGIGLAAAAGILRAGFDVVGVVRNDNRARETREVLLREPCLRDGAAGLQFVCGDLSRRAEVDRVCDGIRALLAARGGGLDRLLYCAGTVTSRRVESEPGVETQFMVNHLAAFRMGLRLRDALAASGDGRLLVVSSCSHAIGLVRWRDPMMARGYGPAKAYMQSKLANVLFVHGFNRRLASDRLRAFAVDPGLVDTDLGGKRTRGVFFRFWGFARRWGVSAEKGAATAVYLATAVPLPDSPWVYYKRCRPRMPGRRSRSPAAIDRMWALSERFWEDSPEGRPMR